VNEVNEPVTRAEHLRWCKDRALEYADRGETGPALSSLMQDLALHSETESSCSVVAELGMRLAMTGQLDRARRVAQVHRGVPVMTIPPTPAGHLGEILPGVPASLGPLRCPACDQRAAVVHHVPDPQAGDDLYIPTLICQCGAVFELEATAYNAGLAAGVLAQMARATHNPGDLCNCEPGDLHGKGICEYRMLADCVGNQLSPPDGDEAEVSLLMTAVERAKAYIESQPCTCTPADIDDMEPCPRCRAIGRLGDEVMSR
jgi:hypothetical protein